MEFSLILFIIGFIVAVYLIFKFIKKVVFAVITLVVLVLVIIGAVFGLVYLDYNYLTSQQDYEVILAYSDSENYLQGISIPVKNQSLEIEDVFGVDSSELANLEPEEVDEEDAQFIVVVTEELFEKLLIKESYSLEILEMEGLEGYDLTLTKEEVLEIMNSDSGIDTLIDILFTKNNIDGLERTIAEPVLKAAILEELEARNMTFKDALFAFVVMDSLQDEKNAVTLVEAFKDEELQVYPERFTFKLVRMLPVGTIKGFLPFGDEEESASN